MEQPKGFEERGDNHVWKLRKTLYGTMQGAYDWAENLDKTFEGHRFYKSRADVMPYKLLGQLNDILNLK